MLQPNGHVMAMSKRQKRALAEVNFDLFDYSLLPETQLSTPPPELPDERDLARRFDEFNITYFGGRLARTTIKYSNRMTAAGSFTPSDKTIKIGRKYHELFPEDIDDTLKHEMIHLVHWRHDADFKREARRLGTSVRARSHPDLSRPPRYTYVCHACGTTYPRQKRLVMASCGKCSRGGRYDGRYKLRLLSSRSRSG